ncbi:hypothetical protein DAI22_08g039100 [Oryza sativa Japonica Group]|nr:hypothetical protein DAI22_08g039100 [Oryza sativa Japonica Group]
MLDGGLSDTTTKQGATISFTIWQSVCFRVSQYLHVSRIFFLTFLKTIKVHHLFYNSVVSFIWHHPGANGFSFLVSS